MCGPLGFLFGRVGKRLPTDDRDTDSRAAAHSDRGGRLRAAAPLAAMTALLLAACGADNAPPSDSAPVAEVITSWTSSGERAALQVVADAYTARGGRWAPLMIAGFDNAGATGLARIVGGTPPTAMSFVAGPGYDDLDDRGILRPIGELVDPAQLRFPLPASLVDKVERQGRMVALPLVVQVQARLFYSRAALAAAGVTAVPSDWPQMFAALDKLKAAGLIPLALGGQAWQESLMFDAVLLSVLGKQDYERLFLQHDAALIRGPGFLRAVEIFGRLRDYVDRASPGRNWNDATELLISRRAGFQLIGDWATSEFAAAGQHAGADFGCQIGFDGRLAMIGGDVLVFPRSTRGLRAQKLLAQVLLDPAVQSGFARKLGALPARLDAPLAGMAPCALAAAAAFRDPARTVPARYMTLPKDVDGDLTDVVSEYWNNRETSAARMVERFASVLLNAT